nr:MAG TPA: hypothetical protein [Caudoviricetes sp.]
MVRFGVLQHRARAYPLTGNATALFPPSRERHCDPAPLTHVTRPAATGERTPQ